MHFGYYLTTVKVFMLTSLLRLFIKWNSFVFSRCNIAVTDLSNKCDFDITSIRFLSCIRMCQIPHGISHCKICITFKSHFLRVEKKFFCMSYLKASIKFLSCIRIMKAEMKLSFYCVDVSSRILSTRTSQWIFKWRLFISWK